MKNYWLIIPILFLIVACTPIAPETVVTSATLIPTPAPTLTFTPAPSATSAPTSTVTPTPNPYAPHITLNARQRENLIKLINTDAEAKRSFDSQKRVADSALTATPNPIDKIQVEGKLDSDPVLIKSRASLTDMSKVYALGMAFAVTGDAKYSTQAKQFILAWARLNQPNGNPINETNLDPLFFAYDLTRATFAPDEIQIVDTWLRQIADAEIASRAANPRSITAKNNWNSHRMKIIGLIGWLLPDQKYVDYAVNGYKQQIADDLNADGSSFDFHERDALDYHVYSLEPLLVLARTAQLNGSALYEFQAANGASLPKSVAFLIPYADGTQTHAEFVNSTVKFDRERAAAGQASYQPGTLFKPKNASRTLEFNYFFDPKMLPLIIKLNESTATRYPTFQVLLAQAQK